jgi:hypothetical protein
MSGELILLDLIFGLAAWASQLLLVETTESGASIVSEPSYIGLG